MKKVGIVMLCLCFLGVLVQTIRAQDTDQSKKSCGKTCAKDSCEKKAGECCQKQAVEIKQVEPFFYAAVEMTGSYNQHGQAYQTLYGEAGKQGLPMDAMSFGLYYNNPADTPEDQLKWEVGLPLSEKKEVATPLVLKKWEFTTVVSHLYDGPFGNELGKAYQTVFEWIGKNGYTLTGPIMEKYLSIPVTDDNGAMSGKIEILLPVKKMTQ